MSNTRLQTIKKADETLFIPFIMAGDPTPEFTVELALLLEEVGANILELGVPYSDPLADGPVIQRAALRALEHGMSLKKAIELVSQMRNRGLTIPVIIFTYYNPVLQLGEENVLGLMKEHDIDGILIPDLPYEESRLFAKRCDDESRPLISLVAPTSNQRIEQIATSANGFLYCVSSLGVTGVRNNFDENIYEFLQEVKKHSKAPVAVGFGISSSEQIKQLKPYCDGIIVGSALVKMIESKNTEILNNETRRKVLLDIKTFVQSLIS
ncbi:tryptophan synthase subunit alpha [Anaerobacillus arseniciselenatis]|uniref:Tryptophan synthase alpha chain n=1 Tax=Anaerobacillus arseniciselenatis TaxID=85682 RepID=A0A1S2LTJ7_9BACI|nr:tryptophan synthase subunit alpha [Anaerobacillus arseniciselenatis]OIJ15842.1 tryptophan synthase subunit alpha [Anaerobacillus arseniciselenatis]